MKSVASLYRYRRPSVGPGLLLVCAFLTGCGEGDSSCPISGSVTVNGDPASGVYLVFHAVGAAASPGTSSSMRTDDNGDFSWTVPEPGEYAVTAFWPKRTEIEEETLEGRDQFQGKYRDATRPVTTITIRKGKNTLPPIELSR